ncbi:TPA: hypothetical protein VD425_001164 [Streptococcus pyogenes]|nr:hypothetical protein [Streptococcus pyogenes]
MTIDVTLFAQWCVALTAIIVFLKWVSAPVKHVLDNNKNFPYAIVYADIKVTDENSILIATGAEVPTQNQYTVTITG